MERRLESDRSPLIGITIRPSEAVGVDAGARGTARFCLRQWLHGHGDTDLHCVGVNALWEAGKSCSRWNLSMVKNQRSLDQANRNRVDGQRDWGTVATTKRHKSPEGKAGNKCTTSKNFASNDHIMQKL